ncbi:MAG: hypothetical protein JSV40_01500 [Deltaproteobacteria bacterium]|nr:MAG: hypothetical protein JSV40_01500 [Deltaproteobacteria bacterium]
MEQIIRILIERLTGKGMEVTTIPAYLRNFAQTVLAHPHITLNELNDQLQFLGWNGFELDNDTFYLILAVFEPDLASKPSSWSNQLLNHEGLAGLDDQKEAPFVLDKDNRERSQE